MRDAKTERTKGIIKIPNGKFTFAKLQEMNPQWQPLTLRSYLKRERQTDNFKTKNL